MKAQMLHEQVSKRFTIHKLGLIVDYADANGNTTLPTAEEYKNYIPNVCGWTTPTADCSFFTGLYLYGLCEKYDVSPSEALVEEINAFAEGLIRLCDVSEVDGFIARAVADDGHSHYPITTEDQVFPWLLGLWRLVNSPASTPELREKFLLRIRRTLRGLVAASWKIPSEWGSFTCSDSGNGTARGAAMCLFGAAIALQLGEITTDQWNKIITEYPPKSIYSRPELISHGLACDMAADTNLIQFWICLCSQLCIEQLITLDPERASLYRTGLALNGAVSVPFMRNFEAYNEQKSEPFHTNWRVVIPHIQPYDIPDGAIDEASRHNSIFSRGNPTRKNERSKLQQSIFSCWMGIVCGDEKTAEYASLCLNDAISALNWDEIGMSYAFAAESAIYCRQRRQLNI